MTQQEKLIVSAYTGTIMTKMADFRAFVEETLGRPVQTVEYGDRLFWAELKERVKPQFRELCADEPQLIQQQQDREKDVELYLHIKKAFDILPEAIDKTQLTSSGFFVHVSDNVENSVLFYNLKSAMDRSNISFLDDEFVHNFYVVQTEHIYAIKKNKNLLKKASLNDKIAYASTKTPSSCSDALKKTSEPTR